MSRLFTFGCSFTSYEWKTWADILGHRAQEFHNFGQAGGGNEQIFFNIIKANKKYKFTKADTVAVCWTYALRKDHYQINKWKAWKDKSEHASTMQWFKKNIKYFTPDEQYLKTMTFINTCNILMPKLCRYIDFSVIDYNKKSQSQVTPWENIIQDTFYTESTQFENKNYDAIFNISNDLDSEHRISRDLRPLDPGTGRLNSHPTPLEHAYFLENVLGIEIHADTKALLPEWEKEISSV